MTKETSPLAALIAGVQRYDVIGYDAEMLPLVDGDIVYLSDVLAALEAAPHVNETPKCAHDDADVLSTPPNLVERAHLDVARLQSGLDNCDRDSGGLELGGVVVTMKEAAETIRALIAHITAQAAQIAGLEAQLSSGSFYKEADIDALMSRAEAAEAEAATLRAEVERLRGALSHIESMTVHSGGEIHGVTAQHWKAAFEETQEVARAALEGKA